MNNDSACLTVLIFGWWHFGSTRPPLLLGEKNYEHLIVFAKFGKTYFRIEVETVSFTSHCLVLAAMISIFTCSSSITWSSLLSSIVCYFINSASNVAMDTKEEIESKFEQKAGTITIERSSPALDGGWRSEYFRQIKLFQAHNWWSLLERYFPCQCERYNYNACRNKFSHECAWPIKVEVIFKVT